MLLNCTTRRAMEKIVPRLFAKYPDAASMAAADREELSALIAPLGFRNRRSKGLIEMSRAYDRGGWRHASELPGIGDYAAAAWEIFSQGTLPPQCPKDHALTKYYQWRKLHGH
jgi:endonuclease III